MLKSLVVPLPPLEVQKQIAQNLDTVSELLALRKKQLKELDGLIKSVFYDMFGDPVTNDKGWEVKQLIDMCKEKDDVKCGPFGTQLNKEEFFIKGVPIWGIPQVNSNFVVPVQDFVTKEKAFQLQSYSIKENDIVMSRKGNVGKCALFTSDLLEGIMHSDVLRIRINNDYLNPLYLLHQLRLSEYIEQQIKLVSHGAIMAGINVTKLKSIILHVPPLTLQNQFANIVTKIEEQKSLVKQSIEEIQTLFDSLMSQYFDD